VRPGLVVIIPAAAIVAFATFPSQALGAAGIRLRPHLAVYDLSLNRARDRLGIVGINGRLAIEVSGSECEDWTVNFRMVSQFQSDDQTVRLLDTQSTTWEAGDGKALNVSQHHFVDSALDSESKVSATHDASGRTRGTVEKPKAEDFELALGTIFPVSHLQRLLDAAQKGKQLDKSSVFDGTEGSKAYTAITFIGRLKEASVHATQLKSDGGEQLAKTKAWPTVISYYDQTLGENNEGVPSYEVAVEMFENGVSGDMLIDYGDYSLDARLAKLELKPYGMCR
jgi:hypothetical protein